jgi:hypothetical protein
MTTGPEAANATAAQPPASTAEPEAASAADLTPAAAWPRRVAVSGAAVIGMVIYAVKVTPGIAPRPAGPQARRIERPVTLATMFELAAVFILPIIVIAAGRSGWVLPSIVITIGPLLLSRDHLVHIPRYRLAGWALTAGPVILVATSRARRSPWPRALPPVSSCWAPPPPGSTTSPSGLPAPGRARRPDDHASG